MNDRAPAVVGVGHSPITRYDDVPLGVLAIDAITTALEDAGLAASDVRGVVTDPDQPFDGAGSVDGLHRVSPEYVINALQLDICWYESLPYNTVTRCIIEAANAVSSGHCDTVVVFRALHNPRGRYGVAAPTAVGGAEQFAAPYGIYPPGKFAQLWQSYMHRYGTTREQMAPMVVNSRNNGLLYEHSYWRQHRPEPLSVDQYLSARMISEPIGLYDCDIPVQGCGAFVVTTAERAKDSRHPPAYLRGWAHPRMFGGWNDYATLDVVQERASSFARRLLANARIGTDDVDVADLYDGFSIFPPLWLEAFGFCGEGEAFDFMTAENIALDGGHLPLNPSGGSLGTGRMHGVTHVMDSVLQVTGRADAVQVRDAEIAVCTGGAQPGVSAGLVFSASPERAVSTR